MDRHSVDWRGYIPAITTPFDGEGQLDMTAFGKLLDWLHQEGMHGIILAGTQGEWFSLSAEEKQSLFQCARKQLDGKLAFLAGCSGFNAQEVIANAEVAKAEGAAGILVTPPPYIRPSEREIYQFYREISEGVSLPLCVYNWPPGTNVDMSLELLSALADLDQVVALKNSTPDSQHFMETFLRLKDSIRVFGFPMNDTGLSLMRQHEVDGTMGAGAVLGREQPDFYNAAWDGDFEEASRLGKRDEALMKAWFTPELTGKFGSAQAILKEALNQQGLPGGHVRKPLLPLEPDGVEQVRQALIELGRISSGT